MMNEYVSIIAALATDLLLGFLFFGGLLLTVVKSLSSTIPALWFMGSFLLRTGIALAGFYFTSNGNLVRLLVCLAGFIIARMLVKRLLLKSNENSSRIQKEIAHEA